MVSPIACLASTRIGRPVSPATLPISSSTFQGSGNGRESTICRILVLRRRILYLQMSPVSDLSFPDRFPAGQVEGRVLRAATKSWRAGLPGLGRSVRACAAQHYGL